MHKLLKTVMLLAALTGKTRHIYVWDGRYSCKFHHLFSMCWVGVGEIFVYSWSICKNEMISSRVIRSNPKLTYAIGTRTPGPIATFSLWLYFVNIGDAKYAIIEVTWTSSPAVKYYLLSLLSIQNHLISYYKYNNF